ncbi:MAG: CRTAC1 family protein [Myxococcota bacterium]|nr:CRTAC1 family protein [Myxococcota bacterium]
MRLQFFSSVALMSSCNGHHDSATPPAVAPEACDDYRMVLSQEWNKEALPQRHAVSKSWPGQAIGDFNGDGFTDVLMAYGGGSSLFLNDGTGQLALWEGATLDGEPLPRARGVAAADIDSDGDLDAFFAFYEGDTEQIFLINDGSGHFTTRALAESAYITWGGSFGDLNGDGRLDLYVATYNAPHEASIIMSGEAIGAGHGVYLQQPDGEFVREDDAIPVAVDSALSLQGALLDADLDGDLDIYMTNDFGPFTIPNQLLLNDGTGQFTVATDCTCDVSMYSMGTARGDGDDDGDIDLFISNIGSPKYLMNLGDGTFADATLSNGAYIAPSPENMTSWGAAFLDADLDSCMDLIVVYGHLSSDGALVLEYESGGEWTDPVGQKDLLLLGDCAGGFQQAPSDTFADTERSRAVAIGDLNGDGRPDAVISGKHFLHVWLAEGGCDPGLTVRLDAGDGNHQGIGASVAVTFADRTVTQWMLPDTTASSSEHALFFGFGGRAQADVVTIRWPDGSTEQHKEVTAGSTLELTLP